MALLVWHCSLSQLPDQPPKNSKAVYPLIINNYQIELQICFFSLKRDRDTWLFLCVCASVCTYMCVSARFAMWVFVTLSPTKRTFTLYQFTGPNIFCRQFFFFFQSRKCDVKEDTREGGQQFRMLKQLVYFSFGYWKCQLILSWVSRRAIVVAVFQGEYAKEITNGEKEKEIMLRQYCSTQGETPSFPSESPVINPPCY